ncbi:hypothetical protein [Mesorhizobium sp.]|uniref:hypothetical protein n=1 Tax=Mesorhizobium sp. TaxID=1871066 RepID=UPI0025802287|nr:hypothetical protein [Mesorhizobium sp.]
MEFSPAGTLLRGCAGRKPQHTGMRGLSPTLAPVASDFSERPKQGRSATSKNQCGMAAMQMLHCTIVTICLHWVLGRQPGASIMGFLTEMFARPRPQERLRYRAALALLHSMSNADRADIGIKPADFPRVAREMSSR